MFDIFQFEYVNSYILFDAVLILSHLLSHAVLMNTEM